MESAASSASSTSRGPSCRPTIGQFLFLLKKTPHVDQPTTTALVFCGDEERGLAPLGLAAFGGDDIFATDRSDEGGRDDQRQMAVRSRATKPWRWGPKSRKGPRHGSPTPGWAALCIGLSAVRCNPQGPKWLSSPKREGQRGGQWRDPCPCTLILSRASPREYWHAKERKWGRKMKENLACPGLLGGVRSL